MILFFYGNHASIINKIMFEKYTSSTMIPTYYITPDKTNLALLAVVLDL
jgi:hypothetical protein